MGLEAEHMQEPWKCWRKAEAEPEVVGFEDLPPGSFSFLVGERVQGQF